LRAAYHNVLNSPGSSFKVKLIESDTFPAAWHFHTQYELTYVLGSTGIRYVGDNIGNFQRGDLVLVGSNLPHSWITIGQQKEKVRCIVIQWDDAFFGDWLGKPEFLPINSLLKLSARGIKFDLETSIAFEEALLSLNNSAPFERLLTFLEILQKLASSVGFKQLAGTSFSNTLTNVESERINIIYDFVKKNHLRKFSLQEVAETLSMGKETFCRYFKRAFNKPFFTFLNEYKISLASKMLIDTDLTISEIAYKTGYHNLTFFHRQFNKFMHLTPAKYRMRYRQFF